jgi:hypothetical protein
MRKWIRRTLLGVGIIVLAIALTGVAVTTWLFPRPEFQNWIKVKIQHASGPGLDFEAVSLALWPSLGLELHEISFKKEGAAGHGPTITSAKFTLRNDAFLEGEFVMDQILVEGLILTLRRDGKNQWVAGGSLHELMDHATNLRDADLAEPSVRRYPLPSFYFQDADIHLQGQRRDGTPASFHVQNLDMELTLATAEKPGVLKVAMEEQDGGKIFVDAKIPLSSAKSAPDGFTIEAKLQAKSIRSGGQLLHLLTGLPIRMVNTVQNIDASLTVDHTGDVKASATVNVTKGFVRGWGIHLATPVRLVSSFQWKDETFSLHDAHLNSREAFVGPFVSTQALAIFDWSPPKLTVKKLELDAYDGHLQGKGSASFVGEHVFSMDVQASKLDARAVGSVIREEKVTTGFELLSADAKLQATWTGAETWMNTLTGTASLHLADGSLASSKMISEIFNAVFKMVPGFSRVRRDPGTTKLERMDASFTIHDARAFTEDFVFISDAYHVQGTGSIGVDTSIDLATSVILTDGGVAKIYGLASVPFRRSTAPTFTPIPVNISGNLEDPRIRADVSGMSLAPFRAVLGASKGVVSGVGKSVTGVGKGVGKGIIGIGKGVAGAGARAGRAVGFGRNKTSADEEGVAEEGVDETGEITTPEVLPLTREGESANPSP